MKPDFYPLSKKNCKAAKHIWTALRRRQRRTCNQYCENRTKCRLNRPTSLIEQTFHGPGDMRGADSSGLVKWKLGREHFLLPLTRLLWILHARRWAAPAEFFFIYYLFIDFSKIYTAKKFLQIWPSVASSTGRKGIPPDESAYRRWWTGDRDTVAMLSPVHPPEFFLT